MKTTPYYQAGYGRVCRGSSYVIRLTGRSCEKKSIPRTGRDWTGQQKSHKSVIFHIFGGKAPRKDIAMKFGTGVDVLEVVTWAEFDL